MGAVNAIGEIACRVCDGDGGFFHENQIIRYYIENGKAVLAPSRRWPRGVETPKPASRRAPAAELISSAMPCPCDCDSAKLTLTRCATSARNPIKVEKNRLQELDRFGFVLPRSRPVLLKLKGFLALFRNIMKPDPP